MNFIDAASLLFIMKYVYTDTQLQAQFSLTTHQKELDLKKAGEHKLIHIHWNRNNTPIKIHLDSLTFQLAPNQIFTTTFFQHLEISNTEPPLTTFSFNREFYCIVDHDQEVSCNGILFFGTQDTPIITLDDVEEKKFSLLYEVFIDEFSTRDNIQGEMLRMLLKRLIIKTTRLAKQQLISKEIKETQIDIVRQFNVLVDIHFKEKRQVSEYAELLYKSPKTLSNLFLKYNQKTPLQIIHERIVLEAKRLLLYTDKTAKEIAYDLGFEEVASFHKMFKKVVGNTPQQFKSEIKGKNEQLEGKS